MHAKEMRGLSQVELERQLDSAHQELFNLRFQSATGQMKNTARLSQVKHEIARLRTVIHEMKLAAAGGEE
jgi:large subunit ribosomal protein L29